MMKRRILAIVLFSVLALVLTACGGGENGGASASDASQPEVSTPDASLPDGGGAETSGLDPDAGGNAPDPVGADIKLTLNRTDIELNKAGATFKLRYTVDPDIYDGLAVFTSSDAKVATVDEIDGTIKAVAPGKATITVKYDSAVATASVNCNWEEEPDKPDTSNPADSKPGDDSSASAGVPSGPVWTIPPAPDWTIRPEPTDDPPAPDGNSSVPADDPPASAGDPSESTADPSADAGDLPASANVDLSAFYTAVTGKYTFPMPMLADDEILDNFYAGMTGIGTEQRLIYICGTSMNSGEFGLVQVKDGKDVDAVKKIFQARIDAQAGGGAWYPMAVESWTNNARVVSNGNYVMMVVHESCDEIVKEFNALF